MMVCFFILLKGLKSLRKRKNNMKMENWIKRELKNYKGKKGEGIFLVIPLRYWLKAWEEQMKDFKIPKMGKKTIKTK